jgi:hypothetical protein
VLVWNAFVEPSTAVEKREQLLGMSQPNQLLLLQSLLTQKSNDVLYEPLAG